MLKKNVITLDGDKLVATNECLFDYIRNYRGASNQITTLRDIQIVFENKKKTIEDIENLTDLTPYTQGLDPRLRPYQIKDILTLKYLKNNFNQGAGLFNEQRTGKTPTILNFINSETNLKKVLIICEAGLVKKWLREIESWMPRFKVFKHSNIKKKRENIIMEFHNYNGDKVIIIPPSTLKNITIRPNDNQVMKTYILNQKWDAMVVDEGHFLQYKDSAQTKTIQYINKNIKYTYILTGTPVIAKPSLTFSLMNFIRPNGQKIDIKFWSDYFCSTKKNNHTYYGYEWTTFKHNKKKEVMNFLASNSTNRKVDDVLKWLPNVEEQIITLPLTHIQAKLMNELDKYRELNGVPVKAELEYLTKLKQLSVSHRLLVDSNIYSNKTNWIINEFAYYQIPTIIFSTFTSYLNILKVELEKNNIKTVMISGKENATQKDNAEKAFQSGKVPLILCNIKAGSKGWTLSKAKQAIFIDRSWRWDENAQAKARFYPTDALTKHPLKTIILTSDCLMEKLINKVVEKKYEDTYVSNYFKKMKGIKNEET